MMLFHVDLKAEMYNSINIASVGLVQLDHFLNIHKKPCTQNLNNLVIWVSLEKRH